METQSPQTTDKQKNTIKLLWVVIIILLLLSSFLTWKLYNTSKEFVLVTTEKDHAEAERFALLSELDSLKAEHERILSEYGELNEHLMEKDSIIQANIKEIESLLASKVELNQIKRKMNRLREITQTYVLQIDSLFTVTNQLKDDLTAVTSSYQKEKQKTQELSKVTENLSEKVTTAAVLRAFKVKGTPLKLRRDREIVVERAKRTEQVKISFTILENSLIEPGPVTIYIRLSDPSGAILTDGRDSDAYTFEFNGQKLQYSLKKQINYDRRNQDIDLFWKQSATYDEGMYTIDVFTENHLIGTGKFNMQ